MLESISSKLFAKVRVSIVYTLPVTLIIFALSTGYTAIVLMEAALPKDPMVMEVNVFTIHKLINTIQTYTIIYILLAAFVGILISRSIHKSVMSVVESYEKIKRGMPLQPVMVQDSGDEIQELTENFNKMVSRLNSYMLDSMMGCTMILDEKLNILSMNSPARKTLNIDEFANVNKSLEELLGGGGANKPFIELMHNSLKKQTISSSKEIPFKPYGGDWVTLGLTASIMRNEDKESVGLFVIFKDLTKINEIREQLQRTEKLVSLGRMSAGIAHEIRNPLGSIKGLTQLLLERAPDDEKVKRYTGVMIREIERLDMVVKNLLNFANPTERNFIDCDINELLHETVNFVRYESVGKKATLVEEYDTTTPTLLAEREKLFQAILNILTNAYQACGPEERIIVKSQFETGNLHFSEIEDKDGIIIEISNTGSTIPPDDVERIFDPFYTTKTEGSGLGLAVTQQIISSHGGNIKVESTDALTTFRIELPLVQKNA